MSSFQHVAEREIEPQMGAALTLSRHRARPHLRPDPVEVLDGVLVLHLLTRLHGQLVLAGRKVPAVSEGHMRTQAHISSRQSRKGRAGSNRIVGATHCRAGIGRILPRMGSGSVACLGPARTSTTEPRTATSPLTPGSRWAALPPPCPPRAPPLSHTPSTEPH